MRQFHVFVGARYYPSSGLGDYIGSYETLGESSSALRDRLLREQADGGLYYWGCIVGHNDDGSLVEVHGI